MQSLNMSAVSQKHTLPTSIPATGLVTHISTYRLSCCALQRAIKFHSKRVEIGQQAGKSIYHRERNLGLHCGSDLCLCVCLR